MVKIYMLKVYYDNRVEKEVYITEEQAKASAKKWNENSGREVWVDELEPEPISGQFLKVRACAKYPKR